jgi:hypothetical protein
VADRDFRHQRPLHAGRPCGVRPGVQSVEHPPDFQPRGHRDVGGGRSREAHGQRSHEPGAYLHHGQGRDAAVSRRAARARRTSSA